MPDAATPPDRFRLDRRLGLGTLFTVLSSFAVAVALYGGQQARLGAVEGKVCQIEARLDETRQTSVKVARIEERVENIQRIVLEIKNELARQR